MAMAKEGATLESSGGATVVPRAHPTSETRRKSVTLVVWTMDPQQQGVSVPCAAGTRSTARHLKTEVMRILGLDPSYSEVFAVWMTSPELSIQLKDRHMPCKLYRKWTDLLTEYTTAEYDTIQTDEPILTLKRSVFLTLKEERKIKDEKVIQLLYNEAVFNVVHNRYPMADDELLELAGIQAVVNLRERDPGEFHGQYFRNKVGEYFPQHKLPVKKSTLTKVFSKGSAGPLLEDQLASKYKEVYRRLAPPPGAETTPPSAVDVMHYYLQRCRSKPYYGSVFFGGQVAKRVNLIQVLLPHLKDRSVVVAINTDGVCILEDAVPREVMLQLPFDLLSWELDEPQEEGETFFSCLWLEWDSVDPAGSQGETVRVTRRLPIYSRQAAMMDAMISRCVDEINLSEKQLLAQREGREAPIYSWDMRGPKVREEVSAQEKRLVCDTVTEDGYVKPAAGGYFTHTRALKRRDPLDKFQRTTSDVEMQDLTSPV